MEIIFYMLCGAFLVTICSGLFNCVNDLLFSLTELIKANINEKIAIHNKNIAQENKIIGFTIPEQEEDVND